MGKLLSILVFILPAILFAQENSFKINLNGEKFRNCKVNYSEISDSKVRLTVTDDKGNPVENLREGDITITRNGNSTDVMKTLPLVESEFAKLNIVLCLDNSSSMNGSSERLLGIIDTLLSSFSKGVNITTVFFDESDRKKKFSLNSDALKIDLKEFGNNFEQVKDYCKKLYHSDLTPKTYLWDQVYSAFTSANNKNLKANDVFYIILSDGIDNASDSKRYDVFDAYKGGKVYTIDFSNYGDNRFLEELATRTNGTMYKAKNADELASMFAQIGKRIVFSGYEVEFKEYFPPEMSSTGFYQIKNSQYQSVKKLSIEDVKTKEFFPLLNYVFFEKDSPDLKPKYKEFLEELRKENKNFNETDLPPLQLDIYDNILNILASRMVKYPEAKLTLVGCNDNEGQEKNNKQLSLNRAEGVKEYFVKNFNLDPARFIVKAMNLPQKASSSKHASGMEENRRVEIYSTDERILDPVEIVAATKLTDPEFLNINLNVKSSTPIEEWQLMVTQGNNTILDVKDSGIPPVYYNWKVSSSLLGKTIDSTDFDFTFKSKDKKGLESKKNIYRIPITYLSSEKKHAELKDDKSIERLSLVLFDFNSSKLDKRNQSILKRVENSITSSSVLKMNGYTDSIGTELTNSKLSAERAKNALSELVKILKPQTSSIQSEGFGEMTPLYDNGMPEGRFYNRTCQLIVETPIKASSAKENSQQETLSKQPTTSGQ